MVGEIQRVQISHRSSLGSSSFKELFWLRHAYVSGSMYRGIASFVTITAAHALYLIKGLYREPRPGNILSPHHVFAKISRPTIANLFINPVPEPNYTRTLES